MFNTKGKKEGICLSREKNQEGTVKSKYGTASVCLDNGRAEDTE